jgi:hypothetical protein
VPEFQEVLIVLYRQNEKYILKNNRQDDAGMLKVVPHLISSLIKICINTFFFDWVHAKRWRKTFVITLWALLHLPLGNL